VKFRYFFEEIRGEALSNSQLNDLCARFSEHMKKLLTNPALLIPETKEFIKKQYQNYRFHIVSGSDQSELRYLCTQLGLSSYFLSIHGSPTPKNDLVAALLAEHQYPLDRCILIGDSINDYEAAQVNQIDFKAFNNSELLPYDSARAGQLGLTEAKRPFQA
jgi:HAD superfamily hydrolase (TIGR01549 family)